MAKEIERKFLVLDERWRETARNHTSMRQAYIASMEDRSLRVRILDGISAKLTIKIGRSAMTRDEFEYDIPLDDAEEMLGNAIGSMFGGGFGGLGGGERIVEENTTVNEDVTVNDDSQSVADADMGPADDGGGFFDGFFGGGDDTV